MGRPSTKCARFANTVTTGRTSAGKSTFLMRLPPAIKTPALSRSEELNQVQGRIPQKKKSAKGSMAGEWTPVGRTTVNTST